MATRTRRTRRPRANPSRTVRELTHVGSAKTAAWDVRIIMRPRTAKNLPSGAPPKVKVFGADTGKEKTVTLARMKYKTPGESRAAAVARGKRAWAGLSASEKSAAMAAGRRASPATRATRDASGRAIDAAARRKARADARARR